VDRGEFSEAKGEKGLRGPTEPLLRMRIVLPIGNMPGGYAVCYSEPPPGEVIASG